MDADPARADVFDDIEEISTIRSAGIPPSATSAWLSSERKVGLAQLPAAPKPPQVRTETPGGGGVLDRKRGLVVAVRHHQGRTWRQRTRRAAPTYGLRRMAGRTACPISDTSRLHVSRVIGAIADDDVRAPISRASCCFEPRRGMSGCSRSRPDKVARTPHNHLKTEVTFAVISAIATFVHTDIPAFVIGVISLSNESPLFHLGTRPNG